MYGTKDILGREVKVGMFVAYSYGGIVEIFEVKSIDNNLKHELELKSNITGHGIQGNSLHSMILDIDPKYIAYLKLNGKI